MNEDRVSELVNTIGECAREINEIFHRESGIGGMTGVHSWVLTVDERFMTPDGDYGSDVYSVYPDSVPRWMAAGLAGEGASRMAMSQFVAGVEFYDEDDE